MALYTVKWIERWEVSVQIEADSADDARDAALSGFADSEPVTEYHSFDSESVEATLFDEEGAE